MKTRLIIYLLIRMSNDKQRIEIRDLREQDWVWISKALVFHTKVDPIGFRVYCALASYANNNSQEAFPSIATLSKKLNISTRTVIRHTAVLKELGFIDVRQATKGGHNIYSLLKVIPEVKEENTNWVKTMLEWAEKRRGSKYVNYGKQIGALGMMKKADYTEREICKCYLAMEKSEFWKERGFDFTNVANEIPKKISQIRKAMQTEQPENSFKQLQHE